MFNVKNTPLVALLWWLLVSSSTSFCHGFVLPKKTIPFITSISRLYYQNSTSDYENCFNTSPLFFDDGVTSFPEVPVVGPFTDAPPLLMGESLSLDLSAFSKWNMLQRTKARRFKSFKLNDLIAVLHSDESNENVASLAVVVEMSTSPSNADNAKNVRLLGIGHVKLSSFTSSEQVNLEGSEPVFRKIARVDLILDDEDNEFFQQVHESRDHALSTLNAWTNRIRMVHQDRLELVKEVQDVQSRLDRSLSFSHYEDVQDWDGIGSLYTGNDDDTNTLPSPSNTPKIPCPFYLDDPEAQVEPSCTYTMTRNHEKTMADSASASRDPVVQDTEGRDAFLNSKHFVINNNEEGSLSEAAQWVLQMKDNNYGLGLSPSAYTSDLRGLAKALKETLSPYYPPGLMEREEFEYTLNSWVGVISLAGLKDATILAESIRTTSTLERLMWVHTHMLRHKEALKELLGAKLQELQSC